MGLVPTWTGCSRGAEACPLGHVKRAARCLSACWRLAKTPASSACGRGHASGHAGSTTLCAGVRTRGPQRASMARRSTGACPGCSWHSVEPRESVWEGQEGQRRPFRARCCAEGRHDHEFSTRGAGGGLARRAARRRLLSNLSTVSFTSLLSLQPPARAGAGRLASPALPKPTRTNPHPRFYRSGFQTCSIIVSC